VKFLGYAVYFEKVMPTLSGIYSLLQNNI